MSEAHLWRSELLGESHELALSQGQLEYHRCGRGPVLVFCHGWLANANLWRDVIASLSGELTCISLDLPLGSHRIPMKADADLSPVGCGMLIAEALQALELERVTLVGNDSGGAYSQIAAAHSPAGIARLVLNSCETPFDEFPPLPFEGLPRLATDPATLGKALEGLRDRTVRASPAAYGLLIKHPLDQQVSDSYALPCLQDGRVLRDAAKAFSSASSPPVHSAGHALIAHFKRPVLFAWSPEDRVFPVEHARRYALELTDAHLELIEDAYSFTPEDQPAALARALARFAAP